MKKRIKVFLVMALLATGGALAQTEPAQTPATPTTTTSSQEFSDLGNYITAMQKMMESSQTTISKEQAQKLLPYLRAIRASKAITPFMANWYKTQIEQQLTPEQVKALSEAAAGMGTAATETTPAQSTDQNQNNQGNNQNNTDQQNQGNTDQQNQGNTDQQNQGNTDQQNQGNTDQQNQANTDQQNQNNADNQNNTANTDTNSQANQQTAIDPSADNPYTQAPYGDALAKVIEQLTQIASA